MEAIEIVTKRLVLKPLGSKYLRTVNEYAMDYENTRYMCHLPNATEAETQAFLSSVDAEWEKEKPEYYEFAILYQNLHVGAVSIYLDDGVGEIGWIVNKKYWGNGFAFESAKALLRYFIENVGITHFIAHCDRENIASYKTMEKLGMVRTGEWGGRRNKSASQDSYEYQYELIISR